MRHSLHRKPGDAKAFHAMFFGLIVAALTLIPGAPLGLLTNPVETLAGVLLPSATVFLLLLCNDREVLGPWVNGRWAHLFTTIVIAVLVMPAVIPTASALYPDIRAVTCIGMLVAGIGLDVAVSVGVKGYERCRWTARPAPIAVNRAFRTTWRMPSPDLSRPAQRTLRNRIRMLTLRGYRAVAGDSWPGS